MSNDRELLELAAKASGFELEYIQQIRWNPLNDDGDALRLAVKLNLEFAVNVGLKKTRVVIKSPTATLFDDWVRLNEDHHGDPLSSTRRAIVRAAAEIGRALP